MRWAFVVACLAPVAVRAAAYTPDGRRLVTGNADGTAPTVRNCRPLLSTRIALGGLLPTAR